MNLYILLTLTIVVVAIILAFLGRLAYMRSIRLRQKLRMSYVFTNITHELLTPLTVLSASVDKMRDDAPQFSHDYDLMQINIQRMVRMLQQILETSKSQAGQLKLLCAQGDVMRYIRETAQYLEPLIVKKKMKYTIECQPESMMGWIDTDKLDKIIYNLVSNAAKYCRENGEVIVRVTTNTRFDRIRIVVSDTGFGIPKEKMKTLFRPFQDGSYRQHHNIGTGLGLALTHDLVYLHKGTIKCESEIDKGTTFTVELPINKEAYSPEQIYEDHQITFDNGKNPYIEQQKSIPTEIDASLNLNELPQQHDTSLLIVEDNPELLMLMHQLLSTYYNIYIATNGLEALKIIQDKQIDLIISDIMMPEMDGYELTKQLKDDPDYAHLPIVLLTANSTLDDRIRGASQGVDDYIVKPFSTDYLRVRIAAILQKQQQQQQYYLSQFARSSMTATMLELPADNSGVERRLAQIDQDMMQQLRTYMEDHLADNTPIQELAEHVGMSRTLFYNKIRTITGLTPVDFYRRYHVERSAQLMRDQGLTVSEACYRTGFSDPKYFSKVFKKFLGVTPSEYRSGKDSSSIN